VTGNALVDKIILFANAFITALALGLIFYAHSLKKPRIDEKAEIMALVKQSKEASRTQTIPLKKLTINLYSRSTRLRFLDVQVNVLPFDESQSPMVTKNEPVIADTIINIAGDMEPDELNSVTGKIILEDRIKKYVNTVLTEPLIKKIYFSRFVIQ
jgi:flagellar FliL protein